MTQAAELLAWYARAKRDLPWRRTRDAWAIWVSEVMLQQTRVEVVRDAWLRFVVRFPDPKSFARVSDDELLAAWRGLGYYRRAHMLRDAARRVVEHHGGTVPCAPAEFAALPGAGAYTTGAVLSIAFDTALPAIDGNVERVLSRVLAIEDNPKRRAAVERMRAFIADLHAHGRPGEVNQALMELGATVCTPRSPTCLYCPWQKRCAALAAGRIDELPVARKRAAMTEVTTKVAVAWRGRKLLVRRVPEGEVNAGQLCLPGLGLPAPRASDLVAHVRETHGIGGRIGAKLATVRHGITRYRITVEAWAFEPDAPGGEGLSWEDPNDESLPLSTVARKVLREIAQ